MRNYKKSVIQKKIDQRANEFLFYVAKLSDNSRFGAVLKGGNPAFGVLQLASDEYYSFQKIEKGLECVIRERLVNPVLLDLFEETGQTCIWPEAKKKYVFFTNAAIERIGIKPIEFITVSKKGNIGYRYSDIEDIDIRSVLGSRKIKLLCKSLRIDHIEIIDWSKKPNTDRWDREDNRLIGHVSLHDFFEENFSAELYSLFLQKSTAAVSKANTIVGYNTIPRLSSHYQETFKEQVIEEIQGTAFEGKKYKGLGNCELNQNTKRNLPAEDYIILNKNFFDVGLYRSLIGEADFGTCFITSEYLFHVFKDGEQIDYTSVVSGYFKSIEQLIYHIMKEYLQTADVTDDLFIKCDRGYKYNDPDFRPNPARKASGAKQVRFVKENESCFCTSMSSLAWLLMDNTKGWNISDKGRKIVCSTLLDYIKECRNEHFHKDNIVDYKAVETIRSNTILLLYLLLGGCKHIGSPDAICHRFGIINRNYNHLYNQLMSIPAGMNKFIIEFNGEESFKAIRLYEQQPTKIDNGKVITPILFVKVNDYTIDSYEQYKKLVEGTSGCPRIEISMEHLPSKLWLFVDEGDIREIVWE